MRNLILILALLLAASLAEARNPGTECRLKPSEIGPRSTEILKRYAKVDGSLPDKMIIGSKVEFVGTGKQNGVVAVHEAIYRPLEDVTYALLPIPLIGVEVERARDAFYVCGRIDTRKNLREVTIYLLHGYNLQPSTPGSWLGDVFHDPKLEIEALTLSELPLGQLSSGLLDFFKQIPLIGPIFEIPGIPLAVIGQITDAIVGDFAGLGVEKIVITQNYVELANGVDLNNPSRARFVRRIDFKKARTSPTPAAATRAISNPNLHSR